MAVAGVAAVAVTANQSRKKGLDNGLEDDEKVDWPDILPYQTLVRDSYMGKSAQISVAIIILLNFISESMVAQILPEDGTELHTFFMVLEGIFNTVFTFELMWNFYGSWFRLFWRSSWNIFDFTIVMISLVAMIDESLPGFTVLRLFRAFRVFRLFKRIETLRLLIERILKSLPGVLNAFVILTIIMGIWSVIGVEFFRNHMNKEFGTFSRAMYTMFQILTLDSWNGIARQLIYDEGMWMASIFFVSYTFIAAMILTNIVVAILVHNFLDTHESQLVIKDKSGDGSEGEYSDGEGDSFEY